MVEETQQEGTRGNTTSSQSCVVNLMYHSLHGVDPPFSGYTARPDRPGFAQSWQVHMCA